MFFQDSDQDQCNRFYGAIRDEVENSSHKAFVEALWERYEPICSDNTRQFLNDARIDFIQRFWEMYLGVTLSQLSYWDADKHKSKTKGDGKPDFYLEYENHPIWIEAVAPKSGESPDNYSGSTECMAKLEQWQNQQDRDDNALFVWSGSADWEAGALRISNALSEKQKKIQNYIKKEVIGTNDLVIIAINLSDVDPNGMPVDTPNGECPVACVLNGWGLLARNDKGKWVLTPAEPAQKSSGATVKQKLFDQDDYSIISAVLVSEASPKMPLGGEIFIPEGTPFLEACLHSLSLEEKLSNLGMDFKLHLNPKAKNPLPLP
ncbi:MAG: hypothetical protein SFZ03_03975 [Candidatus Melainabacteria bacterium]|nr:hypothetical protein [Candidatus Melainabacteria bacterium]